MSEKGGFRNFLNYVSALIIIASIGVLIFIIYVSISNSENLVKYQLDLKFEKSKVQDSTKYYITQQNLDSLKFYTKSIDRKIERIETIREDILKLRKEESYYGRIYTSIIALILALAGFFGFKTMTDIKSLSIERAEEAAKSASIESAEKTSKEILTEEFVTKSHEKALSNVRKLYEKDIDDINQRIFDLEQKVDPKSKDQDSGEDIEIVIDDEPFNEEEGSDE